MNNKVVKQLLPFDRKNNSELFRESPKIFLKQFASDDGGEIVILTLILLVVMLVVGGMGVDFMRYESRRVVLQSVSDRAVLAAAELDESRDGEEVVRNYFEAAGFGGSIVGDPIVEDTETTRSVHVQSSVDVSTIFLRLVGKDELIAHAVSAASEGVGKTEISLVLDISGSMRDGGSSNKGRFGDMQEAAKIFANKVLDPSNGGQISLTIVPYAGSVNPGPEIFEYLNGERYGTISSTGGEFPQVSSCLEFEQSDWATPGLPGTSREQVPHFMRWAIAADVMDWGWCPQDVSAIRYAMDDASEAGAFIDSIRMHDGTGTHYGMKYGLAALDPNSQPAFGYLSGKNLVPGDFSNRPAAWSDGETRKIIVLMTDGQITDQFRPIDILDEENLVSHLSSNRREVLDDRTTNLANFYAVRDMAKDPARDIEVYTVAFETYGSGQTEMENCASGPSMFFSAAGEELIEVFDNLATQITQLRLTQ